MDSVNIYPSFQSGEVQVARIPQTDAEMRLNTERRDTASSSSLIANITPYLEAPSETRRLL